MSTTARRVDSRFMRDSGGGVAAGASVSRSERPACRRYRVGRRLIVGVLLMLLPAAAVAKQRGEATPKARKEGQEGKEGRERPTKRPKKARGPEWIEFSEPGPPPAPTAEQQQDGFILFRRSTLERIYQQSKPRPGEPVSAVELSATQDQYEPAQIAVYPLRDLRQMQVSVSDLKSDAHVIPSAEVTVRMVRFYGVRLSLSDMHRFGVVPKTLEVAVPFDLPAAQVRPYWITVHVPPGQPGGHYSGTITFKHAGGERALPLSIDVLPVTLQRPDILYGPLCVNALANLWKWLPQPDAASSDKPARWGPQANEMLRDADLMFRDQRQHGMNSISLRSGTKYQEKNGEPYLPDLDAAMELSKKYGFDKPLIFCLSHLLRTNKINRSANYKEYDPSVHVPMARKIAAYYTKKFHDAGLPGIIFIAVEEPNLRSGIAWTDPADTRQKMARELTAAMKEAGGTMALTCTPDSVKCAIEYLDYWIMAYKRFTPQVYQMAQGTHAQLAMYANATLMSQGTYFTRFMWGYYAWANGIGMVPWTYPIQPKRFPANVDGRGEGGLNVKDSFIGLDGQPIPTIQWEIARQAIDDVRYLTTIESLAQQARALGTPAAVQAADQADRFLADIRSGVVKDAHHYAFEARETYEPVPQDGWDAQKFEHTRAQAFDLVRQLTAVLAAPNGGQTAG